MTHSINCKKIDLAGQALMLAPLLGVFTHSPGMAMLAWFTVGGWQVLSAVAHRVMKVPLLSPARRRYERVVIAILSVFALTALPPLYLGEYLNNDLAEALVYCAMVEAFIVLLAGPVLAIWYASIIRTEMRLFKHNSGGEFDFLNPAAPEIADSSSAKTTL